MIDNSHFRKLMSSNESLFKRLVFSSEKRKIMSKQLQSFEVREKSLNSILEKKDIEQKRFLRKEARNNFIILFLIILFEILTSSYIIKEI